MATRASGAASGNSAAEAGVECRATVIGLAVLSAAAAALCYGTIALAPAPFLGGAALAATWWIARRRARSHLLALSLARPLPPRSWAGRSFAVECATSGALPPGAAGRVLFRDSLALGGRWIALPEGAARLRYAARCPRRGTVDPGRWELESSWPLGWFATRHAGRFAPGARASLSLPAPALPASFSRELAARLAAWRHGGGWGHELSAEFRLLREFRSGDSARSVHWPSSLRHRLLLARETDPPPPRRGRVGVLLHSCRTANAPGGPEATRGLATPEGFELLLKMASGLLRQLRGAGVAVWWQHFPEAPRLLKSRIDFDAELDRLAAATRCGAGDVAALIDAARAFDDCDERLVLSDTPREAWEPAVRAAVASVHCLDLRSFSPATRLLVPAA